MRIASLLAIILLCHVAAAQKPKGPIAIDNDWRKPACADIDEGRSILLTLRDFLRVKCIQVNNELPAKIDNDYLQLKSSHFGLNVFYSTKGEFTLSGNAEDNFKGTTIKIHPLEGIDAPILTLTFQNIWAGEATIAADRQSPIVVEGEALLNTLKDRVRAVCIKNNGLDSELDFSGLGIELSKLGGKYFAGDVEFVVAGNNNDGFKGTRLTIYPLADARAAKMSLVFASVDKGTLDRIDVDCSWGPRESEGRNVLLTVGGALRKLYLTEHRIPAKVDLKTLDMKLEDVKGQYYASEILIDVRGMDKDAYKDTVVTVTGLGTGHDAMSLVFESGVTSRMSISLGYHDTPEVAEGRTLLNRVGDQLRSKFLRAKKNLPDKLDLDGLGLPKAVLKKVLELKFYGDDIELKIAGRADDGYKGTTITVKPVKGVDAPEMVLTFESVSTGKSEITVKK